MSQRECAGFNWPGFSVAAGEPIAVRPVRSVVPALPKAVHRCRRPPRQIRLEAADRTVRPVLPWLDVRPAPSSPLLLSQPTVKSIPPVLTRACKFGPPLACSVLGPRLCVCARLLHLPFRIVPRHTPVGCACCSYLRRSAASATNHNRCRICGAPTPPAGIPTAPQA
jgi:hypothetical protein